MSTQSFQVCCCFRRRFRVKTAEAPEDVKQAFKNYSTNGVMNIDDLHRFMVEFQGEKNATREDAQTIFDTLKHLNFFQRRALHLEGFFRYLLGDHSPPLSPSLGVHHDMNAPLAHYFLYTGHNSYLTGNQISSDASVEPIIEALGNGVRVIELDLWPNSTRDDVIVCHGGTLTTPIALIECLRAIKVHAFSASEYPVVITFEDHLTSTLQTKVAKMVTETFGGMLYLPKSELKELPSPESLKRKIMISTKPPKEYLGSQSMMQKGYSQNSKNFEDNLQEGEGLQDEDVENAVPEYRDLIAIHAGKLKGRIEDWLRIDPNNVRRLSMSEQELESAASTHGTQIVRFTQHNLLRVYPKGTRLDSSNYNPLIGWMHGAQMVALNMQGHGKFLWITQGMFRANGGCGYVKKPDFLLNANDVFDPNRQMPVKKTLMVTVYMGQGWRSDFHHTHFDTYSPPDFYVRIGIVGVSADNSGMRETKIIFDDWTPMWNANFKFPLTVPELALLRIEVKEYDTSKRADFAGQTCLPVSELRTGIRSVPLHNRKGEKYKYVRLLMRFEFISYDSRFVYS